MDYRYLGRSALKVSPLCLGAMMFGDETDEATATRIIDKAHDQGINFIDTADVYHAGRSEQIVGRAIAARRDDWVVATKFGFPAGQAGPNAQGQSRKWICQAVDASLKRLGTDYLDILYFHRALADAPLDEGMRAIADLIRQGKVRYFGVSKNGDNLYPAMPYVSYAKVDDDDVKALYAYFMHGVEPVKQ
ncbi:aldo/keto reductase, partial [Paraburkholderia sp. Se-20369]|nr:aldo/keto reductase [Paraburkholderia sp. Se-20369]